ncbi:hypothetical protein ACFL1Q_02455 [Patescibacteria group bacterium]
MSKNKLNYEFAPTGGGDETGFNDPVTTSFKGDIPYFLARESIQNIIDNKLNNSSPARTEFTLSKIRASGLVNVSELKNILIKCRDRFSNNMNSVKFYNEAINKISKDVLLPILKISDFNTTGLSGGDHEVSGNYYNFCKAVGASSKEGGLGGSFGLGKGAYFSASGFKMIFFSSIFDKNQVVFQGKLRLSSFDDKGIIRQGNGSFGHKSQKPVRETRAIPELFRRKEQGTDIYIVDFKGGQYWESDIIKSVLNNFWPALSENYLEVKVGDMLINKDNLEKFLNKYYDSYDDGPFLQDRKDYPCPIPYYMAYKNGQLFEEELPVLGKIKLFLYFNSAFNNKIAFYRKTGMVIEKRQFASIKRFVGVFACIDDKGSEILRAMENPQHNEWKKKNAVTTKYEKQAEKADKEIKEFIKKCISSIEIQDSEYQEIPGLDKYLSIKGEDDLPGLSSEGNRLGNLTDEESPVEKQQKKDKEDLPVFKHIPIKKKLVTTGTKGDEDIILDDGDGGNGDGRNKSGKEGEGGKKIFKNIKFRTYAQKDDGRYFHYVLLKGPANKKLDIEVKAGTDTAFDTVDIKEASILGENVKFEGNQVRNIILDKKGFLKLRLNFSTGERYSLNITAYENS